MATIRRIEGKTGLSYQLIVTHGTDQTGKQVRHYRTWKPAPGMTERQIEKALQKAAADFEREIEQGYILDNRQSFAQYAEYVLDLKERAGLKHKTVYEYRQLTDRIYPAIGHLKLTEIRPQHLNAFYRSLAAAGSRKAGARAAARIDLNAEMKKRGLTRAKLAELAKVSSSTASAVCRGCSVTREKAEQIAQALGLPFSKAFTVTEDARPLSGATMLAYHRFISTVLEQAEKELLVPYNAAEKATPPKLKRREPNYFQPAQIVEILDALEGEPLKWRALVHLLIVTGCRRGRRSPPRSSSSSRARAGGSPGPR